MLEIKRTSLVFLLLIAIYCSSFFFSFMNIVCLSFKILVCDEHGLENIYVRKKSSDKGCLWHLVRYETSSEGKLEINKANLMNKQGHVWKLKS